MVARVPLFASMDESEIAEIARLIYTRTYLPGVPLVRTGDARDAMFVIASGEAAVELSPRRQVLLKDGDFFGEMALLERRRHAHDVVATTRCRVSCSTRRRLRGWRSGTRRSSSGFAPWRPPARPPT